MVTFQRANSSSWQATIWLHPLALTDHGEITETLFGMLE
jgi:hypothetical protein